MMTMTDRRIEVDLKSFYHIVNGLLEGRLKGVEGNILSSVNFKYSSDCLTMTATDGNILLTNSLKVSTEDGSKLEDFSFSVDMSLVLKAIKSHMKSGDILDISVGPVLVHFSVDGYNLFSIPQIDIDYPRYEQLLPNNESQDVQIGLSVKVLEKLLKGIKKTGIKDASIVLRFKLNSHIDSDNRIIEYEPRSNRPFKFSMGTVFESNTGVLEHNLNGIVMPFALTDKTEERYKYEVPE